MRRPLARYGVVLGVLVGVALAMAGLWSESTPLADTRLTPQGGAVVSVGSASGGGIVVTGTASAPLVGLSTSCTTGQVLAWNGSAWACAAAGSGGGSGGGTVTSIATTAPITGGTITNTGTIGVNIGAGLQNLAGALATSIGGACSAHNAVTSQTAAGALTCSTFFDTAGTGLSSSTNTVSLNMAGASCAAGTLMSALGATGTGTCSATGVVTGGVSNTLPKYSGANALATSLLTDDGTTFSVNAGKFAVTEASGNSSAAGTFSAAGITSSAGFTASAANNVSAFTSTQSTTSNAVTMTHTPSGTTGSQADLLLTKNGTANTTSAALNAIGLDSATTTTRSAGANNLTNIAGRFSASGAQVNRAIETDSGDVAFNTVSGAATFAGSASFGSDSHFSSFGGVEQAITIGTPYNDIALANTTTVLHVTSTHASGTAAISGFAGGYAGRLLWVIYDANSNGPGVPLSFVDSSVGSVAANRILCSTTTGAPLYPTQPVCPVLDLGQAAMFEYDGTAARWRAIFAPALAKVAAGNGLYATADGVTLQVDTSVIQAKLSGGTTNALTKWTSSSALGNSLITDNGTTVTVGNLAGTVQTEATVTSGTVNDYALGATTTLWRITTSGAYTLNGLTGGVDGRLLVLQNNFASTGTITIANEAAGSTAANRISTVNSGSWAIAAGEKMILVYDGGTARWSQVGTTHQFALTTVGGANIGTTLGVTGVMTASGGFTTPNGITTTSTAHLKASGTSPALTSCGTTPSITGSDIAGTVVTGTGATACTITFAATYTTAPTCTVELTAGGASPPAKTVSATVLTLTTAAASTSYDYICVGH